MHCLYKSDGWSPDPSIHINAGLVMALPVTLGLWRGSVRGIVS